MEHVRCDGCGVSMEDATLGIEMGGGLRLKTGPTDGVLGKFGIGNWTGVRALPCPECGRLRLYADVESS